MNISLTKELQKFVKDKVKSGMYSSSSEVIRDSLRWFKEREAGLADLRGEIDKGLQGIKKGNVEELSMAEVITEAKAIHAKKKKLT